MNDCKWLAWLQMPAPLEEVGTAADISLYLHGLSFGDSTHPICRVSALTSAELPRRFGFETASTSVDGLWQGPNAITQNFDTVAWRIKLLGFNTIRLPFSFQVNLAAILIFPLHFIWKGEY